MQQIPIEKKGKNSIKELEKSLDNVSKIIIMYTNHMNKSTQTNELKKIIKSLTTKVDQELQNIQKSKKDIRIRQRDPKIFDRKSLRTTTISKSLGIKAVIGSLPSDTKTRVQTLLFNVDPSKGETWTLKKAKEWASVNKSKIKISVDVNDLVQKCQTKLDTISK